MTAVVLTSADRIEQVIVFLYIFIAPVNILPNPAFKSLLHLTRLFLCKLCLLGIDFIVNFSVLILHTVTHENVSLVQQIFKNVVAAHARRSIGFRRSDGLILILSLDFVLTEFRADDRMIECVALTAFTEKPVVILRINPVCADADGDLACFQILWYHCLQSSHISLECIIY